MTLIWQKSLRLKILSILSYFYKLWDANMIEFGPKIWKVSSPYLCKLYNNLRSNLIRDMILQHMMWTQVHKNILGTQPKVEISGTQQKC